MVPETPTRLKTGLTVERPWDTYVAQERNAIGLKPSNVQKSSPSRRNAMTAPCEERALLLHQLRPGDRKKIPRTFNVMNEGFTNLPCRMCGGGSLLCGRQRYPACPSWVTCPLGCAAVCSQSACRNPAVEAAVADAESVKAGGADGTR